MRKCMSSIGLLFLACQSFSQEKTFALPSVAPTAVQQMLQRGNPSPASAIRIRCARSIDSDNTPLFVVDGILYEPSNVSQIKPADIIEIQVLKTPLAETIYGCRALHGVVIITTKKAYHRKFIIRDAKTLLAVSNATIKAKSVKTGAMSYFVADTYGRVETDSLRADDYVMSITSSGYKTQELSLQTIQQNKGEIKLEPAFVELEEVIVYPNPVALSGTINLSFPNVKPGQYQIRILNSSGQLFYSFQKQITGKGETEQIQLKGNTIPGIYMVQVLDNQKKLFQTSKIIVQ